VVAAVGLWDFNQPGLADGVAARCLREWASVPLRWGWYWGQSVSAWCVGGWQGFEAVEKTSYGVACGNTQERDDRAGVRAGHKKAELDVGSGAVERPRRLPGGDQRVAQVLRRDALKHHHGTGAKGTWRLAAQPEGLGRLSDDDSLNVSFHCRVDAKAGYGPATSVQKDIIS
jgi:hypothetical protein